VKGTGDIWTDLGITPTDDRRAIRSAYAAKLKAIDPEGDPKAFIVLREAMEQALKAAESHSSSCLLDKSETSTISATAADLDDQHMLERETALLARMLHDGYHVGETDASLLDCLHRIWANPDADQIEMSSRIEGWLATLIADRLPLSDTLLEPTNTRYGWDRHEIGPDLDARLITILNRRHDLQFIATLAEPGHRYHEAYALLTHHPDAIDEPTRRSAEPSLRAVLRSMRARHPTAEWHFGEDLIAAWVEAIEAPRERWHNPGGIVRPAPVFPRALDLPPTPEPAPPQTSTGGRGVLIVVIVVTLLRLLISFFHQ